MIKAVLTDIEGTTTDIDFVHKVLFPYAYQKLPQFVREQQENEAIKDVLQQTRELIGDNNADIETLIQVLLDWIEQDKKLTPLKALQGLIWDAGYKNGDFRGHVYDDAYQALQTWHAKGIRLFVFSSGSVKAQKLLFSCSDFGDITPLFSSYFDTTTGAKREAQSYRSIAESTGFAPAEIAFLSDVQEELDAAREAGMATILLARNQSLSSSSHKTVRDFAEIDIGHINERS